MTLGRVIVSDLTSKPAGAKLHDWLLGVRVCGLAFSADARHLAVSCGNSVVYILRLYDEAQ